MYGRVKSTSCLLAWARRAPSHVASRNGWESDVSACCPSGASCVLDACEVQPQISHGPPKGATLGGVCSAGVCGAFLQQAATFASKGGGAKRGHLGRSGGGKDSATAATAAGPGKGAAAEKAVADKDGEEPTLEFDLAPFVSQMRSALEHLNRELAGIRTGRASPGLLEAVAVADSSHGSHVPLRALGTVVVRNPHLLVVEVYDHQDAQPVAAAIQSSALKLQARVEGSEVLVELPRLTMEMVERMARLAAQEAEATRAEVRRARHQALDLAKRVAAAGGVGSEEARRREAQIQAATNQYIGEVDALLKAKERDLRGRH